METVAALSGERDLAVVAREAPRLARRLLDTDLSTLLTPDAGGKRLDVVGWDGVVNADAIRELATPVGQNLAGLVADERRALRSDDVTSDARSCLPAAVRRCKIASAMLVPVDYGGDVASVLAVETRSPRSFTDADEALLQLLANQVATAFRNAGSRTQEHGATDEVRAALASAMHENTVMRSIQDARDRLTRTALDGAGLEGLVAVLSTLISAPLALTDQFGAVIAWSGFPEAADAPRRLEGLGEGRGAAHDQRVVTVGAAEGTLGYLVAWTAAELGEIETLILESAAGIFAGELIRERSSAEAEMRLHGGLLESLVGSGAAVDHAAHAGLLGVDLGGAKCMAVITPAHPADDGQAAMKAGRVACSRHGLRGVFGRSDGAVMALLVSAHRDVSRASVDEWLATCLATLEECELPAPAAIGISSVFDELEQVGAAVESARQAARVGDIRGSGNVTFFDDVELLAVFAGIASRDQLERYVRHRIGALLDYDVGTTTDLARTLEVYLDHACVARHAAAALFLHPHSLRYRLRRVREVQHIDLDDPFERLSAHLALKLRVLLAT
jgi:purine catabolism regulator